MWQLWPRRVGQWLSSLRTRRGGDAGVSRDHAHVHRTGGPRPRKVTVRLVIDRTSRTQSPGSLLPPQERRPGLKPFSRLANPVWVSANLAYLRDLDFMESRMEQVGKKKPGALPDADPESDKPSTKTKTPKKKNPKGKGKGNEADAKDSEA